MTIVPALLLLAWGIAAAAGLSLQAPAHAATSNVTVTATVLPEIHIAGACAASTIAMSTSITNGVLSETPNCAITFGSNTSVAATPATLQIQSASGGASFFCYDADGVGGAANSCTANKTFADHSGVNTALTNGEAGGRLNAASTGCTGGVWTNGATNYNPVSVAATLLCNQTTAGADGGVTLVFGAKGNATMTPNTAPAIYDGIAQLVATAN